MIKQQSLKERRGEGKKRENVSKVRWLPSGVLQSKSILRKGRQWVVAVNVCQTIAVDLNFKLPRTKAILEELVGLTPGRMSDPYPCRWPVWILHDILWNERPLWYPQKPDKLWAQSTLMFKGTKESFQEKLLESADVSNEDKKGPFPEASYKFCKINRRFNTRLPLNLPIKAIYLSIKTIV